MSCVKIIGQDLGFDLDIMKFVDRFPELCHRDIPEKRYAFHVNAENLRTISGQMGFTAEFSDHLDADYREDCRALLDFHAFLGDLNHAHCLVYLHSFDNDTKLKVICPSKNDYDEIPSAFLKPWKCNIVEIRAVRGNH